MRRMLPALIAALTAVAVAAVPAAANRSKHINHIVVIYEENHSFDNLYGGWEGVDGLERRRRARTRRRSARTATPYSCLLQNDVNLTSPPLPADVHRHDDGAAFTSHFTNAPFRIDDYIAPRTRRARRPACSRPTACSRRRAGSRAAAREDLVHRYYQEQYQLDGGRQDRYVTGSDAVGLTMGRYDTKALPIYEYLHGSAPPELRDRRPLLPGGVRRLVPQPPVAGRGARRRVARARVNDGGPNDLHSIVDANGMPTTATRSTTADRARCKDRQLTASCSPPSGRRRPASRAATTRSTRSSRRTSPTRRAPRDASSCRRRRRRRSATG